MGSSVRREVAIIALRAAKVGVSENQDGTVTLIKGNKIDVMVFEPELEKKILFRFQYRYGVPIHWFYHPEMIPTDGSDTPVQ